LPKFSDASFVIETGNRLIPTSGVPLVNLAAEKNIEGELPVRYTAATYCFRSEAGSAGRHTRGFIRLHQFSKVELVSICTQNQSQREHELILHAAETMQKIELSHRVLLLCSIGTPFSPQTTYDIEVWMPGQKIY
jgi:seryl-tRNA synthetase